MPPIRTIPLCSGKNPIFFVMCYSVINCSINYALYAQVLYGSQFYNKISGLMFYVYSNLCL